MRNDHGAMTRGRLVRRIALGHSWGARYAVAYAQQHRDHVAALVLTAPDKLPLEGVEPPPGDLTTRLGTSELAREYLRLLKPRNLFAYGLRTVDARIAHRVAGDQEMDRRLIKVPVLVIKPACDYVT